MKIELRNESVEVSGYVNAVGRESRVLRDKDGYFTEIIEPGTFARALMRGSRDMLLNHDGGRVLGHEGENLELREDAVGLYATATVTDPEVMEKARNGELRGWSFGFLPIRQRFEERGGMRLRILEDIDLREVSIIDGRLTPAYAATSVFTRAAEGADELECRMMEAQEVRTVDSTEAPPPVIDYQPYRELIEGMRG